MVRGRRKRLRFGSSLLALPLVVVISNACVPVAHRAGEGAVSPMAAPRSEAALPSPRWIAHALGRVPGWPIANCRECFEASVGKGYRYLEADLMTTSDGALAVVHDGLEKALGLPTPFTLEQFMRAPLLGGLHPLDGEGLAALLARHELVFLITDFKTGNDVGLPALTRACDGAGVDWRHRVIPQVHSGEQARLVESMGFERAILTLYRFGRRPEQALDVVRKAPHVVAVTVPVEWFDPSMVSAFRGAGKLLLVNTVNDMTRARELFAQGVDGIYTDVLID